MRGVPEIALNAETLLDGLYRVNQERLHNAREGTHERRVASAIISWAIVLKQALKCKSKIAEKEQQAGSLAIADLSHSDLEDLLAHFATLKEQKDDFDALHGEVMGEVKSALREELKDESMEIEGLLDFYDELQLEADADLPLES